MKPAAGSSLYAHWLLNIYRGIYRHSPIKFGLSRIAAELRPYLVPNQESTDALLQDTRLGHQKNSRGQQGFMAELDLRDRIQFMMYARGCHEPATEQLFADKLTSDACFVDIGANIGYFSLLAAALKPKARIFAFEPMPHNTNTFRRNIKLNGFSNITVVEKAVGEVSGAAWIEAPDPIRESGWNTIWTTKPTASEQKSGLEIVQIVKLDDFLDAAKAPAVDFIKIDVEGAELAVLKGATQTLTAPGRRQLIVELNEACLSAHGTSSKEVNALLLGLGYECFRIRRNGSIVASSSIDSEKTDNRNFYYVKD